MKRISFLFRRFHVQLAVTLVFAFLIPIAVTLVVNYKVGTKIIIDKNNALLTDNLMLSRNNANSVIYNYKKALYQIVADDAFLSYFEEISSAKEQSAYYTRLLEKIEQRVQTDILLSSDVLSVGLVDINKRKLILSQGRAKDQGMISFFNEKADEIHERAIARTFPELEVPKDENTHAPEDERFFYISHRVYHHETMKILGTVILFIKPSSLNNAINNMGQAVYQFSEKVILTKSNVILCSKDNLIGFHLEAIPAARGYLAAQRSVTTHESTIISRIDIDGYDLYLLNIVDKKRLLSESWTLWLYTSCAILISSIVALSIFFYATRKTVHSINHITRLMNNLAAENVESPQTEMPGTSEIETIEHSFEQMVNRIERLLLENEQQYRRILQVTEASKEAELRSLELQINPHFLFNTIDTINWMAIRKDEYEISKQLNNLAQILRYTVYDVNGMVTVRQELQWMEKYLALQQNRFNFNFDYAIDTTPESLDCRIHKLLLQPFLENAIIHGFETIDYKGLLTLRLHTQVTSDCYYLIIEIRDNGVGIPEEKALTINTLLKNPQVEFPNAVGLQNMVLRLIGYYGTESAVQFSSIPGDTYFLLKIPQ